MLNFIERYVKTLALLWLFIITVLFFLPGSALPKNNFLGKIFFDKWVHFGFFAVLLFLWRFYFPAASKYSWWLLLLAFCYGLSVEVGQHFFVANRSFDLGDILADMAGAFAGLWFWMKVYKKNRPL